MEQENRFLLERLEMMAGRAKTRKELAKEYGVSPRTLRRWLKKKGFADLSSDKLLPVDLIRIYKAFGLPRNARNQW